MNNQEIRQAAKAAGVHLYEVAAVYGVNDGNFSRKLRWELPETEKEKIMGIIKQLSSGTHIKGKEADNATKNI